MDILAHTLWANATFSIKYKNDRRSRWLGALFGVLPDLFSFSPVFIYSFLFDKSESIFNPTTIWAHYAKESYNYTHSIVIFVLVTLIVAAIRKWKVWWPMFGWLIHILIDIPTHQGFYETPFLFPISSYRFTHGISWGEPHFMIVNYSALALVYILIFYFSRRKSG